MENHGWYLGHDVGVERLTEIFARPYIAHGLLLEVDIAEQRRRRVVAILLPALFADAGRAVHRVMHGSRQPYVAVVERAPSRQRKITAIHRQNHVRPGIWSAAAARAHTGDAADKIGMHDHPCRAGALSDRCDPGSRLKALQHAL